jgi:hypothetical protein
MRAMAPRPSFPLFLALIVMGSACGRAPGSADAESQELGASRRLLPFAGYGSRV